MDKIMSEEAYSSRSMTLSDVEFIL